MKFKHDTDYARQERIKVLTDALTVGVPQATADLNKYIRDADYYLADVRRHMDDQIKVLADMWRLSLVSEHPYHSLLTNQWLTTKDATGPTSPRGTVETAERNQARVAGLRQGSREDRQSQRAGEMWCPASGSTITVVTMWMTARLRVGPKEYHAERGRNASQPASV